MTWEDGIWGRGGGGGGAGIDDEGAGILGEVWTGEEVDAEGIFRRVGSSTSKLASMETVMLLLTDDLMLFPMARMLLNTL